MKIEIGRFNFNEICGTSRILTSNKMNPLTFRILRVRRRWWHALISSLAAVLFCTPLSSLHAQDGGEGGISGRVFNERTGRYLNQALVTIDGSNARTFTNQFGEYTVYNAPSGMQTVRVTYTGFDDLTADVYILEGETVEKDFRFRTRRGESDDQVYELEEFVVGTSDFQSFSELAIQEERYSVNLKNVVAADAYGSVAQGNVGEFVKFIPGVIVDYGGTYSSGADATSISVRGFRPDQTAVTIDGIPVSNAQPGSLTRAIGLDMLSINNASRVEVIKVPTPDQPNASIGGTVNLISKTAFEYPKPTFSYRVYFALNSENLDVFKKTPGPLNESTFKALPSFDLTYALPINEKIGFSFTLASANQFNENHTAKMDYKADEDLQLAKFVDSDGTVTEPVYADIAHPWLNNFGVTDAPRVSHRHSAAVKMDYRPWEGHLITLNYQVSIFDSADAQRRFELNAGARTGGVLQYGPELLESRAGGYGKAEANVTALDKEGLTQTSYLKWEFIKGPWNMRSHVSYSLSESEFISGKNGHFSEVQLNMGGIDKAIFSGIKDGIPSDIVYFGDDGNELDENLLENYNVTGYDPTDPSASSLRVLAGETFAESEIITAKFDLKRELDFLPFEWMNAAFKFGGFMEDRRETKWGRGTGYGYQYLGSSGVTLELNDFLDEGYRGVSPGFGFPAREWPDVYKVYSFFKDNPEGFSDTYDVPVYSDTNGDGSLDGLTESSVAAENWASYVNTQKAVSEKSYSYYWQIESDFFSGRLSLVGGMRQEVSERAGRSPFRDSDWKYLRKATDENGDGILDIISLPMFGAWDLTQPMPSAAAAAYEAAGAVYPDGTLFSVSDGELYRGTSRARRGTYGTYIGPGDDDFVGYVVDGTLQARQYSHVPNFLVDEKSKGRPSPIVSSSYDLTDKIMLRLSWSQTYAKPDYEGAYGILRTVRFDQDQDGEGGSINISNPNLKPWTSNNWDFGVAYYTDGGGQISVSYYTKSIEDFHTDLTVGPTDPNYLSTLAELGFGAESIYATEGWLVTTPVNGEGTATTYGYELEARHDLGFLGKWGKTIYAYASFTTKKKSGNQNTLNQIGSTSDDFMAGGISWNWWRLSARVNATWRDEEIRSSSLIYKWPDASVGDPTPGGPVTEDEQYEVAFVTYQPAELKVDVNFGVRIGENYSLDFSARNVTNTSRDLMARSLDGSWPEYARVLNRQEFGVNFTIGFSGKF
jgi:TonB-dependent receptor